MFERFDDLARQALVEAQAEALALGHDFLGTEHQLLGILRLEQGVAWGALQAAGVSHPDVSDAVRVTVGSGADVDADALAAIGIDIDVVRRAAEDSFGPGALERAVAGRSGCFAGPRLTPRAKKVMELALREALALKHNHIGTEHILLGILREGQGVAAQVLRNLAPDTDIRRLVLERLRNAS
jgi:ATP-dependent Clp protease ATP-binding subunit ClpA